MQQAVKAAISWQTRWNPDITLWRKLPGIVATARSQTGESRMINVWPIDNIGAGADVAKYRFQWNYPIFFSPNNPKKLYAAGNQLFSSEDEGKSWQVILAWPYH